MHAPLAHWQRHLRQRDAARWRLLQRRCWKAECTGTAVGTGEERRVLAVGHHALLHKLVVQLMLRMRRHIPEVRMSGAKSGHTRVEHVMHGCSLLGLQSRHKVLLRLALADYRLCCMCMVRAEGRSRRSWRGIRLDSLALRSFSLQQPENRCRYMKSL